MRIFRCPRCHTALIKPPKPPKVYTPQERFDKSMESAFLTAGLLAVFVTFPMLLALCSPVSTFAELSIATPFFCGWLFLFFVFSPTPLQGMVFRKAWAARLPEKYSFLTLFLGIPILRQFIMISLSFRMGEEKHDAAFVPLTALSGLCALCAWTLWWIFGFLSTNAGWIFMTFSVVSSLVSLKRYLGFPLSRKTRRRAVAAGLLWLIFGSWLWLDTANVARELSASRTKCAKLHVPLNASAYLEQYYAGSIPDADFTALVKRDQTEKDRFSIFACDAADDLLDSPEKRRARRDFLNSEFAKAHFSVIDHLSASGRRFRYKLEPNGLIFDWDLPYLRVYRNVALCYQWRILNAAEHRNRSEAMRLLRLFSQFQETAFFSNSLISALVAIACEQIRLNTIARLIGLNVLSDADLTEIGLMNREREFKLKRTASDGVLGEATALLEILEKLRFSPFVFLKTQDSKGLQPNQWRLLEKLAGAAPMDHLFTLCIRNDMDQCKTFLLNQTAAWSDFLLSHDDFHTRKTEFAALKRVTEQHPVGVLPISLYNFFLYGNKFAYRSERAIAMLRMCDIALRLEQDRRVFGTLPNLPPDAPRDSLHGKAFDLVSGKIKVWKQKNSKELFYEFTGWQLHSPGTNPFLPEGERTKAAEDFFNVITDRAVPAPQAEKIKP